MSNIWIRKNEKKFENWFISSDQDNLCHSFDCSGCENEIEKNKKYKIGELGLSDLIQTGTENELGKIFEGYWHKTRAIFKFIKLKVRIG